MLRKRFPFLNDKTQHQNQEETNVKLECHKSAQDAKLDITLKTFFGFSSHCLSVWKQLVRFLCQPADPACLGIVRLLFGFLMTLDTLMERGMSSADIIWGSNVCRFPLFNFLHPLSLEWMYMVYMIMFLGAVGVMLGFKFRFSCLAYLLCYWYLFFLEKTSWNNHSYLFGIIAFLFLLSDANRYCSLDGLFKECINNAHIPHWNYLILQAQVVLLCDLNV